MKRREFILQGSLLIGATSLLTGCGRDNLTAEISNTVSNGQKSNIIDCTYCSHCVDVCPKKIDIPKVFSIYNDYKVNKDKKKFIESYNQLSDNDKPEQCVKCGMCLNYCDKNIQIPEILEKISNEYQKMI